MRDLTVELLEQIRDGITTLRTDLEADISILHADVEETNKRLVSVEDAVRRHGRIVDEAHRCESCARVAPDQVTGQRSQSGGAPGGGESGVLLSSLR